MKNFYLAICMGFLSLTACGPTHVVMPDELKGIYNEYFAVVGAGEESSGSIVIDLSLPDAKYGVCHTKLVGTWEIVLNQKLWYKLTPMQQKTIMFHELTHCVLGYGHSEKVDSYMNAVPNMFLSDITLKEQTLAISRE